MSSTGDGYQRGDVICRPTDWIDILKFFVLNYGLHAMTVVTEPGCPWWRKIYQAITAIVTPSFTVILTFGSLIELPMGEGSDLKVALRAGALCMVVPSGRPQKFENMGNQVLQGTSVHGQYPVGAIKEAITTQTSYPSDRQHPYSLVQVPPWFAVEPFAEAYERDITNLRPWDSLKQRIRLIIQKVFGTAPTLEPEDISDRTTEQTLACNYSAVKTISAILQIFYGSIELYRARGDQLEKYGYAAYSLTVLPYILMSVVNLLTNLSVPEYPSIFIVHYRGLSKGSGLAFKNPTPPMTGQNEESNQQTSQITDDQVNAGPLVYPISTKEGKTVSEEGVQLKCPSDRLAYNQVQSDYPEGWWTEDERNVVESMVTSTVGEVYGNFGSGIDIDLARLQRLNARFNWSLALIICQVATPYVVIASLTGFKKAQSTQDQRAWIMCWLVMGQAAPVIILLVIYRIDKLSHRKLMRKVLIMVLSTTAIGGFVTVAQMMAGDKICYRI